MKKATNKSWLSDLALNNLGPKLGAAYSAYLIAEVIMSTTVSAHSAAAAGHDGSAAKITLLQAEGLTKMISGPLNGWPIWMFLITAVLYTTAMAARSLYSLTRPSTFFLFRFSQLSGLFARACGFFGGMLSLPLVLVWTIMLALPAEFSAHDFTLIFFISLIVVATMIAMHRAAFFDAELPNAVVYTVEAPLNHKEPLESATIAKLAEMTEGLPWIGKPEALAESDDGRIVIGLPIRYPVRKWKNTAAEQFMNRLLDTEATWKAGGYKVLARVIPVELNKKLSRQTKNSTTKIVAEQSPVEP